MQSACVRRLGCCILTRPRTRRARRRRASRMCTCRGASQLSLACCTHPCAHTPAHTNLHGERKTAPQTLHIHARRRTICWNSLALAGASEAWSARASFCDTHARWPPTLRWHTHLAATAAQAPLISSPIYDTGSYNAAPPASADSCATQQAHAPGSTHPRPSSSHRTALRAHPHTAHHPSTSFARKHTHVTPSLLLPRRCALPRFPALGFLLEVLARAVKL